MKRCMCMTLAIWLYVSAIAQTPLCLSTNKTTSLIFPFAIKHVDRGTQAILAQQVKDVPTILLVKAGSKGFQETNLSVITADGSLYSFQVCYDEKPSIWVHRVPIQRKKSLANDAHSIRGSTKVITGIKDKIGNTASAITGIYVRDNVIYYQLSVENKSPISYAIDLLRFYITDKEKSKRTAVQENELKPLYVAGNTSEVKAHSTSTIVIALEKFTIPDAKYLVIQIMEKNGGRHLLMKVGNKKIMQAVPLPEMK